MSEIKKDDVMKALGNNPESFKQLDKLLRMMNNNDNNDNDNKKDNISIINKDEENITDEQKKESYKINLKQKISMMKMKRLNKKGKGQYMEKIKKRIIIPNN